MSRRITLLLLLSLSAAAWAREPLHLPYAQAGMSPHRAAVHLLNRLAYGPRPGEADKIVAQGLENWVEHQLAADNDDWALEQRLAAYPSLGLSSDQLRDQYLFYGTMMDRAAENGLPKPGPSPTDGERKAYGEALKEWAADHDVHFVSEMFDDLLAQKLLRATQSENQLREVLTDFWFNHFNVAAPGEDVRRYLVTYERDTLRAQALGHFGDMVESEARHPAMLLYLNNGQSYSAPERPTTLQTHLDRLSPEQAAAYRGKQPGKRKNGGLNENFARELMELHTLGVDGGYTQSDVTEVARALTGWGIYPFDPRQQKLRDQCAATELGYQHQGEFLFRADLHDAGAKTILGHNLPAGSGMQEGELVLRMLIQHPSTAHHIARKLAVRFVSDSPSDQLVGQLALVYLASHGDIREMLRTLVQTPDFWAPQVRAGKLKSPFELAVSSLRGTGAELLNPRPLADWVSRMGEPLYACLIPTGYPDTAQAWVNTGTLLNRMNFGLLLASGRLNGVVVTMDRFLRDVSPDDPETLRRVAKDLLPASPSPDTLVRMGQKLQEPGDGYPPAKPPLWFVKARRTPTPILLAQARLVRAVGVVLGSPEFQQR